MSTIGIIIIPNWLFDEDEGLLPNGGIEGNFAGLAVNDLLQYSSTGWTNIHKLTTELLPEDGSWVLNDELEITGGSVKMASGVKLLDGTGAILLESDIINNRLSGKCMLIDSNFNNIFGIDAGNRTLQGVDNFVSGRSAGQALTTGGHNTFIGRGAGQLQASSHYNIAFGKDALRNPAGFSNIAMGLYALYGTAGTKRHNVALNDYALAALGNGYENTAIGRFAAYKLTNGSQNIAIGSSALYDVLTGGGNIGLGTGAIRNTENGSSNIAMGSDALAGSSVNLIRNGGTGNATQACIGIGIETLMSLIGTNYFGIAIGHHAGRNITSVNNCIIMGNETASGVLSEATNSVAIGSFAGHNATVMDQSVFIGYGAGRECTGMRNILLGMYAGNKMVDGDRLVVDNRNRTDQTDSEANSIIFGEMAQSRAQQKLTLNANVTIPETLKTSGIIKSYESKVANYTLTKYNEVVSFNGTDLTATLPTASTVTGSTFTIKNRNVTTLIISSINSIDDGTPITLAQWEFITVISNGVDWEIIGR